MAFSNSKKRCYNSIDLCKFIFSFAIIAIHTGAANDCTNEIVLNVYSCFVELGVPFFFLASGYLLAVKMDYPYGKESDITRLKGQLAKIIRMYLTWTLIYFPLAVYHFISSETPLIKAILYYIRGFFFLGESYNSWPLWYLLSTIYALIIIGLLMKMKKSPTFMIIISVLSSIIAIGVTTLGYYEHELLPVLDILQKLIKHTIEQGRIFNGLVYIPIGMLLAHKKIPKNINRITFIICIVANYFVDNSMISYYLLIFTSISLFGIVECIELKNNKCYAQFRDMSTTIYLTHMYIWTFYYKIVYGKKTTGIDSFVVTAIIVTFVAFVWLIIKKKRKAKMLSLH